MKQEMSIPSEGEHTEAPSEAVLRKTESLEVLWPIISEVFDKGSTFSIYPRGTSMLPLLRPGEDGVLLAPVPETIRRMDIILYRRRDGHFVLHRVLRAKGDVFDLVGDNQIVVEHGICREQILAVALGRYRDGVYTPFSAPALRRYAKRRLFFLPVRSFFIRGKRKLCRIFKKT